MKMETMKKVKSKTPKLGGKQKPSKEAQEKATKIILKTAAKQLKKKVKATKTVLDNPHKEKILFLDIETSLAIMAGFSLWNPINYKNIIQDWYIISASWKWLHDPKTHSISVLDDKANLKGKGMLEPFNDKVVVEKLLELLEEADAVCYHNGDRFDIKKINTRILYHKLKPAPKIPTIDTLKVAKANFGITSNRLDYISTFLGHNGKLDTSKGLWMEVLKGNLKAIKEMVEYNEVDVIELEKVYMDFRPFIQNHPNFRHFTNHAIACPVCKSTHYQKRGYTLKASGKFARHQCQDCGKWFPSKEKVE